MAKRYLITSALPYANGPIHLGHLAGAYLPADIFVRYLRLMGKDVVWVCGSDEHGAAITIRAKKEGISPKDIVDKYHALNKDTFARLGISFDYYHRTSDPLHHQTSQDFFTQLNEMGDQFEVRTQEQYYDADFDQFLADRYIKGTCPKCGHTEAYGDQCESCGSDLSPLDLIDPISTLSGKKPELRETKHWYFRLENHGDWLKKWIETGQLDGQQHHDPQQWKKHVLGQCMSWLNEGLQARAITRDLDWGIAVPLEEAKGKVLYVWFDAPIGYISSTIAWAAEKGKDWREYWQDEDTELIHFIGKDNIVFHCIIFPAMLKAHGQFVLPKNVPANQFLNFEGQKFSKSRGWGIEQHEYLELFADFPNKEDALRWALTRNLPEQRDADFTWDEFTDYHDKDLADKLGNFINRVVVLSHKYFPAEEEGKASVPAVANSVDAGKIAGAGSEEKSHASAPSPDYLPLLRRIGENIENYQLKQAAADFVELATWGNVYLQEAAPWSIAKENPDDPRIAAILRQCLELSVVLSIAAAPFIPFTAAKLRGILGLPALQNGDWAKALQALESGQSLLEDGHLIGQADVLFPKINDRKDDSRLQIVQAQKDKLAAIVAAEAGPERPAPKELITFDDFTKLDLRTATILAASPIPKADKLLQLTVDLGNEQRTIVSGIAQHYSAEALPGQKVVIVANLAPRKMRGVESQGMILMAEDGEGQLVFVSPPKDFEDGWVVR